MSYCYLAFRTNVLLNLCCPGHLSYYSPNESEPLLVLGWLFVVQSFFLRFSPRFGMFKKELPWVSSAVTGVEFWLVSSVALTQIWCWQGVRTVPFWRGEYPSSLLQTWVSGCFRFVRLSPDVAWVNTEEYDTACFDLYFPKMEILVHGLICQCVIASPAGFQDEIHIYCVMTLQELIVKNWSEVTELKKNQNRLWKVMNIARSIIIPFIRTNQTKTEPNKVAFKNYKYASIN